MKFKQNSGFSLIEIMVVVVIIGMLVSLVGPNVMNALKGAGESKIKADMAALNSSIKMYKLDNFVIPTTEQGLEALVIPTDIAPEPRNFPEGGYIEKLPRDPWENEYLYMSPADEKPYDIYTLGSDGVRGGEDDAADRSIWDESAM